MAARHPQAIELALSHIESRILLVRGRRVMLDSDLAAVYGVPTKRFNEQVRRNAGRFPPDFMFRLSAAEWSALRSQFATLKTGRGEHRKYLPHVFSEHGALMAANVVSSPRALEASVYVVRAFIRLREIVASNKALAAKLEELECKVGTHDEAIAQLIAAMRELMKPGEAAPKRRIGFV